MGVVPIRGAKEAPKAERSTMDTLLLTPEMMNAWELPPFQAPLKVNAKVLEVADQLREQTGTPAIVGVISLGILEGYPGRYWLYDGQHRREGVLQSGVKEVIADVRIRHFDTMEEMALEYLKLNTPISRKSPDDQLRALQESSPALKLISKECPFIGYRYIRANPEAPLVSMAAVLRRWFGSGKETPSVTNAGGSAPDMARNLSMEEAKQLVRFMKIIYAAWGKDIENARLWSALNMIMCMWLWRVLVLDQDRSGSRRYVAITEDQYRHCLMSVSADKEYSQWLLGRNMGERDRAPCYRRLRTIFMLRIHREIGKPNTKIRMPQPIWMTN